MEATRRGPGGRRRRAVRPTPQEVQANLPESASGSSYSSRPDTALVGYSEQRPCPVCGHVLYFNCRQGRFTRRPEWFYRCFRCANEFGDAGYNDHLRAHGVQPWRLKSGDFSELGPPLGRAQRSGSQPPPGEVTVQTYRDELARAPEVLRYLIERRGLSILTVTEFELGYDRPAHAVTFPVRNEGGALENLKRRYLDPAADPKTRGLGRPSSLYPNVPSTGALLLVAGEVDALTGRQMGLPAITTTCGTSLPDHLAERLAGRTVFVMYDIGEEAASLRSSEKLRTYGCDAFVIRLALLGLPLKADLNDLLRAGGTAREVKRLIRRELRSAA